MACGILPEQGKSPSPALAGGFLTAEPPGKPSSFLLSFLLFSLLILLPPSLPSFLPSSDKAKWTGNSKQCNGLERRWQKRLLLLRNSHADLYLVFMEKSDPEGSRWKPLWHGGSPRDTELEDWSSVRCVSTGLSFCNDLGLSVRLTIQGLPCQGDSDRVCIFSQPSKDPHAPQLNAMYPDGEGGNPSENRSVVPLHLFFSFLYFLS